MPAIDIAKRQLDLVARLAALEPALSFMGGMRRTPSSPAA
jgi:hypothetical protein